MSKKLLTLCLILSAFITAGCSESKDEEVKLNTDATPTTKVGPFAVSFDPQTKTYSHSIEALIDQGSGNLKYLINSGTTQDIEFVSATVSVQGCDAKKVIHEVMWFPETDNLSLYVKMNFGKHFYTAKNKSGTFLHHLENLDGCTQVKITTVLKEHPIVSRVGQNCGFITGCVIVAECKRQYSDKTIDSLVAYRTTDGTHMVRKSLIDPANSSETVSTAFSATTAHTDRKLVFQGSGMSFKMDKLLYDGSINYGGGMSDSYTYCNYTLN